MFTVYAHAQLRCDADIDCKQPNALKRPTEIEAVERTAREAADKLRAEATREGWRNTSEGWRCPDCVKTEQGP